jgi:predicted transporter
MARFRAMPPIRQAAIVGLLFFSFYIIYAISFLSMPPADALQISLASSLLFMGIYYITSVIMLKKRTESKDIYSPKKGKRKS